MASLSHPSPFLDAGRRSRNGQLAMVSLGRDNLIPVAINASSDGECVNTRFGSFPHSTLVDVPWGTQLRAVNVNNGYRKAKGDKKRKRDDDTPGVDDDEDDDGDSTAGAVGFASTGFAHLLPPTPETWTVSLPHRTQVVYTADYSYILQRLRVRPGDCLIEAGAGSGSFTHAAVRATFCGYPLSEPTGSSPANNAEKTKKRRNKHGHVYSFEYHMPRACALAKELRDHGMHQLVTITHADVYKDGFSDTVDGTVPQADAVFLDLPAPWMALKHLARHRVDSASSTTNSHTPEAPIGSLPEFRSPLNPKKTVRLCTFSPCIEQVQRTTCEMRRLGWTEIEMVEVLHRRIEVRRDRIGMHEEGLRGVNATPATVDEALGRLRDVGNRIRNFHGTMHGGPTTESSEQGAESDRGQGWGKESKEQRLRRIKDEEKQRKTFKEGRLVHRTEPELKTHTSYLCFAVLPRCWTPEDEEKARKRWGSIGSGAQNDAAQKQKDEEPGSDAGTPEDASP